MWQYLLRRVLLIIPTVFLVLSVIFTLIRFLPGDPVLATLQNKFSAGSIGQQSYDVELYNQVAKNLNLDKPQFYFSIIPSNIPASIFDLEFLQRKYALQLIEKFGNPDLVLKLINKFEEVIKNPQNKPPAVVDQISRYSTDLDYLKTLINSFTAPVIAPLEEIEQQISVMLSVKNRNLSAWPNLIWHGRDNQYHDWIVSAFTLQLGSSIVDGRPVTEKIYRAFIWTFSINIFSITIGYGLAILIGVYAGWQSQFLDKFVSLVLYLIYSIPVFWLTTILVVFFSTSEYGNWTNIFAAVGVLNDSETFIQIITENLKFLAIPIVVLSTNLLAYIARIVRNSVVEEKNKTYVQHARTKGLSENYILWHHVFRNASFPLITLLASVFPAALAGSLVVEIICNIPGAGRELYNSIDNQDWAVVNGVVMMYTFLTILGLLVSDILYRWLDPRVKWEST